MSDIEHDLPSTVERAPWQRDWNRVCELALGLLFLLSAVIKAFDINPFIVQLSRYGVITLFLQTFVGLAVIGVETIVAFLLFMGPRHRRLVLGFTCALLLAFTGVVLYGWLIRGLDDCGCLGALKMHPALSLLRNLVMLGMAWVAWKGRPAIVAATRRPLLRRVALGLAKALVVFGAAGGVLAYAVMGVERVQPEIMGETPFAAFVFEDAGRHVDLGKGDHFVALLSTTCRHCLHAVKPLNDLDALGDLPDVVALCKGTEKQFERFKSLSQPRFPARLVGYRAFYQLLGMGPPRYVYVRDGKALKIWDGAIPSAREIRETAGIR